MTESARKKPARSTKILIGLCLCMGGVYLAHRMAHRQIAFDARQWRAARTPDGFDRRFWMMRDVEAMIRSGRLSTKSAVLAQLGPPESGGELGMWLYCLGPEHGSFIRIDSDWLELTFDASGNLLTHRVRPD